MKETSMKKPEVLTDETEVFGVPVTEWNKAFVGNFEGSLSEVRQRVAETQNEALPDPQSSTIDEGK
jgi:hypothetical protein